jgi:hypothetical protein
MPRFGAEFALEYIHEQTAQGRDVNRKWMKPYTPGYKAAKLRKYGSASPVNLRGEGDLMGSLGDYLNEGFVGPSPAQLKKAEGNQKHRDFLTPSHGMRNYVHDKLHARVMRILA